MSYLAGINGTVSVGGTGSGAGLTKQLPITRWAVNPTAEIVRFINSLTGKHAVKQSTFLDATGNFDMDVDPANQPFLSNLTYAFKPGDTVTNLYLILDLTAANTGASGSDTVAPNLGWAFPQAIIPSMPTELVIAGKASIRANFEASGKFIPPGGAEY